MKFPSQSQLPIPSLPPPTDYARFLSAGADGPHREQRVRGPQPGAEPQRGDAGVRAGEQPDLRARAYIYGDAQDGGYEDRPSVPGECSGSELFNEFQMEDERCPKIGVKSVQSLKFGGLLTYIDADAQDPRFDFLCKERRQVQALGGVFGFSRTRRMIPWEWKLCKSHGRTTNIRCKRICSDRETDSAHSDYEIVEDGRNASSLVLRPSIQNYLPKNSLKITPNRKAHADRCHQTFPKCY